MILLRTVNAQCFDFKARKSGNTAAGKGWSLQVTTKRLYVSTIM